MHHSPISPIWSNSLINLKNSSTHPCLLATASVVCALGLNLILLGATHLIGPSAVALWVPVGSGIALILAIASSQCKRGNALAKHIRSALANNPPPSSRSFSDLTFAEQHAQQKKIHQILPYVHIGNKQALKKMFGGGSGPITTYPLPAKIISISKSNSTPENFQIPESIERFALYVTDDDTGWGPLEDGFPRAFHMIDKARKNNEDIFIHCHQGISRSVTLLIAYLVNRAHVTVDEALDFVRINRMGADPNFFFLSKLHDYARLLGVEKTTEQ